MESFLSGIFKAKSTEYDHALNPADAERYLKSTKRCVERTQAMIASTAPSKLFKLASPKFNNAQCTYLADKLKLVVESGEWFLEIINRGDLQFPSRGERANCLEVFKHVCSVANAVENFIQGCCKDSWIHAAVLLADASEHVTSVSFNMQLCTLVFRVSNEARQCVTPIEVDAIFRAEVKNVKVIASQDRATLLGKVIEFLGREDKTKGSLHHLANLLLQRLQSSTPPSAGDASGSSLSKLYETLGGLKQKVKQKLGSGSFGTVYKAMWLGAEVAKKTFTEISAPDFEKEVSILIRLSHPSIASLLCYAKGKEECSIVMELMDRDLSSLMKRRKEKRKAFPFELSEAIEIMLQIGSGIRYLHEMKIVHRDIKSSNILVRCLRTKELEVEYILVKVADFGLSKIKESTATYSKQTLKQGTPRWMAPEMLEALEANSMALKKNYPLKVDVYSFAMVCSEILTGEVPFPNAGHSEVFRRVLAGERPKLPGYCHPLLKHLIERCWNHDASTRPYFDDICAELRHIKCVLLVPCNITIDIPSKVPADRSLSSADGSGPMSGCSSNADELSSNMQISIKPRIDWVIGLDFGTTYSGFAFATTLVHADDTDIKLNDFNWPCTTSEKPYCKTLTALYYRQTGPDQLECDPAWGHLARSEYIDHRRSQHCRDRPGQYFTKFKLLLNKEYLDNPELLTKDIPSPHTATSIITDYLKQIGEFALDFVEKAAKLQEFSKGLVFSKDSVQWCVTVPSIWDENAKQQMKACMVNAGLVSANAGGVEAVKVVLEPEAASFHCHRILRESRMDVSLNVKDKILVADVGGGTVDIVVQELVASGDEFKVKELSESSGGLCGGTYVDESFMRFLSRKIRCLDEFLTEDDPSYKTRLLKDWEEIKCAFGHRMMSSTEMNIDLHPKLASKWEAYEDERGSSPIQDFSVVELTQQDLKAIFDPVVDQILELIDAQLSQVPDIKVMFVVGGFAGSPYLMQRIRARFSGKVAHIVSPANPGSAIMEGAVSLALHPDAVVSRIAKKTYGTDVILSFDEELDPPELLEITNAKKYCKNRFDIFVRKGCHVEVNTGVMKEYCPHSNGQFQLRFDLYSSTQQNPRYTEGATVTKEGGFAVNLPPNYRTRDMLFQFTVYFGRSSIELRVEARSKNGQQAEILKLPVEYFQ